MSAQQCRHATAHDTFIETTSRLQTRQSLANAATPPFEQPCERTERLVEQRFETLTQVPRQHRRDAAGRNRYDERRPIDNRRHDETRQLRVIDDIDEHVALS